MPCLCLADGFASPHHDVRRSIDHPIDPFTVEQLEAVKKPFDQPQLYDYVFVKLIEIVFIGGHLVKRSECLADRLFGNPAFEIDCVCRKNTEQGYQ